MGPVRVCVSHSRFAERPKKAFGGALEVCIEEVGSNGHANHATSFCDRPLMPWAQPSCMLGRTLKHRFSCKLNATSRAVSGPEHTYGHREHGDGGPLENELSDIDGVHWDVLACVEAAIQEECEPGRCARRRVPCLDCQDNRPNRHHGYDGQEEFEPPQRGYPNLWTRSSDDEQHTTGDDCRDL